MNAIVKTKKEQELLKEELEKSNKKFAELTEPL